MVPFQEDFYALVDWAFKLDPLSCISMHGITDRYLSAIKQLHLQSNSANNKSLPQSTYTPPTFNMPTEAQIAGGHKANINNPNTSEESKQNSRKILEEEFNGGDVPKAGDNEQKNPGNVAGGLKATLKNPNVSDEAKESAKERLDNM